MPGPDEHEIDPANFFTQLGWSSRIFGKRRHVKRGIQGVYLVGGELASDTTAIRNVTSSRGVLVDLSVAGSGIVPSQVAFSSSIGDTTYGIGDWGTIGQASIAGNVAIAFPTATPTSQQIFELRQLLYIASCDGTVATRTPTPRIQNTLIPSGPIMTQITDFNFSTALPSLTASEQGRVFVPLAPGLVQLNDNGTITTGATSPLPIYFNPQTTVFQCTLTAGVAGDSHGMLAVVRRVA